MGLRSLIAHLEQATEPARPLEGAIGLLMGWKRKVDYVRVPGQTAPARKVSWYVPDGDAPGRVPEFTASIDEAWKLAKMVAPGCFGGVTWHGDHARAQINDGPVCLGSTPAIAICIAALRAKLEQEGDED